MGSGRYHSCFINCLVSEAQSPFKIPMTLLRGSNRNTDIIVSLALKAFQNKHESHHTSCAPALHRNWILILKMRYLKAWSHECRISLRMTNECNFLASIDICRKCVSCLFDPLTGRSSLGNLRCLCVLLFFFVNVICFSCVKSHSFLICWPMRHYSELVWPGLLLMY